MNSWYSNLRKNKWKMLKKWSSPKLISSQKNFVALMATKRVKDFVTLASSVYYLSLRQQKVLATMQCKHENAKFVTLFWEYFLAYFKEVNGDDAEYNPVGFVVDMAGANSIGLKNIFGPNISKKIKGCECHFRSGCNSKKSSMDANSLGEFKDLCEKLLLAATPVSYESA